MDELDRALARLAAASPHPDLDRMSEAVLARITARPQPPLMAGAVAALAALAAALMGIASTALPATAAEAQPSLTPLAPASVLTPAALIDANP